MKKLLIFTIALTVLVAIPYTVAFGQAPKSIMAGGLYHGDGQRDFAFWGGVNVDIMSVPEKGVKDYARMGYFYSNSSPNEVQSVSIINILEKQIWELSPTMTMYVATGHGALIEIEQEEDNITLGLLVETGIQFGDKIKVGLGLHYEPIDGEPDRKFPYLLIDLFP